MFYDNSIKFFKELNVEGASSIKKEAPSFSFSVDGTSVTVSDASPGMELSAHIEEFHPEHIEETLSKMLRGNFLGMATKRACLGLDETGSKVVIQATLPTVKSYREFRDTIEDFVNTVVFWKKELFLIK